MLGVPALDWMPNLWPSGSALDCLDTSQQLSNISSSIPGHGVVKTLHDNAVFTTTKRWSLNTVRYKVSNLLCRRKATEVQKTWVHYALANVADSNSILFAVSVSVCNDNWIDSFSLRSNNAFEHAKTSSKMLLMIMTANTWKKQHKFTLFCAKDNIICVIYELNTYIYIHIHPLYFYMTYFVKVVGPSANTCAFRLIWPKASVMKRGFEPLDVWCCDPISPLPHGSFLKYHEAGHFSSHFSFFWLHLTCLPHVSWKFIQDPSHRADRVMHSCGHPRYLQQKRFPSLRWQLLPMPLTHSIFWKVEVIPAPHVHAAEMAFP